MAKNLQAKLLPTDNLSLFDINRQAVERLAEEIKSASTEGASVALAPSVADASRDTVRVGPIRLAPSSSADLHMMRNIFKLHSL